MASKKGFIEQREQGDFAVRRPGAKRASAVAPTQQQAIAWAKAHGIPDPDIERVHHTKKGKPDKWRGS